MADYSLLQRIIVDPDNAQAATRDGVAADVPKSLPTPKASNRHPSDPGGENGSVYFVGTATTIMYGHHTFSECADRFLENGKASGS